LYTVKPNFLHSIEWEREREKFSPKFSNAAKNLHFISLNNQSKLRGEEEGKKEDFRFPVISQFFSAMPHLHVPLTPFSHRIFLSSSSSPSSSSSLVHCSFNAQWLVLLFTETFFPKNSIPLFIFCYLIIFYSDWPKEKISLRQ